jgi:hypothetical protein
MNRPAGAKSTVKALVLLIVVLFAIGLLLIAFSGASDRSADALKASISCAIGLLCLLVVPWSIRTGHTGARMLNFERAENPLGFWLIVLFWALIGTVVLAYSVKELHASFKDHAPNNSFKPTPLRGAA